MSSWEIQKEAVRKRLLTRDHENKNKNNAKKKAAENWWFGDKTNFTEQNRKDLFNLNLNWNPNNGFINIRLQKKLKDDLHRAQCKQATKNPVGLEDACVVMRKSRKHRRKIRKTRKA